MLHTNFYTDKESEEIIRYYCQKNPKWTKAKIIRNIIKNYYKIDKKLTHLQMDLFNYE